MKKIGGILPTEPVMSQQNQYFSRLCRPEDDLLMMMSGRCGIDQCLKEILLTDRKKVAYVPMYTCETVIAPFAKAGYELRFYEVDKQLRCIYDPAMLDEISLISVCGYYGFCNYDREFLKKCRERGIIILEDITHSLLSEDGIDPLCDYVVGSFRKWIGVPCGGIALKRGGRFQTAARSVHREHLEKRRKAVTGQDETAFWDAEMQLRQIFDNYLGDEESAYLLYHADYDMIRSRRRNNYETILKNLPAVLPGLKVVFPELTAQAVPSHFCLYAENRDPFREYLHAHGVNTKVFWPVGPKICLEGHDTVKYVYDHIVSVACDQRYDEADMKRLGEIIAGYSE